MGETETPHFYDFEIFERPLSSQNKLCLSFETPRQPTKSRNETQTFRKYVSTSRNFGTPKLLTIFEKMGAGNDEDPSKKVSEILDMKSISSKNGMLVKPYLYGNGQLRNKSAGGRNQKSQTSPGCAPQLAPVSPPETQPGCGGGVSSSPSEESAFTELLVLRGQPQNSCKTPRKHSKNTDFQVFRGPEPKVM